MGIFFDNNIFAYKYFEIFVCINFLIEVYSDLRVQTSFKYFMKTYADICFYQHFIFATLLQHSAYLMP